MPSTHRPSLPPWPRATRPDWDAAPRHEKARFARAFSCPQTLELDPQQSESHRHLDERRGVRGDSTKLRGSAVTACRSRKTGYKVVRQDRAKPGFNCPECNAQAVDCDIALGDTLPRLREPWLIVRSQRYPHFCRLQLSDHLIRRGPARQAT